MLALPDSWVWDYWLADELATWTGSVIRNPDGTWFLFYTGTRLVAGRNVQSIGYATSPDLYDWTKQSQVAASDDRWYEKLTRRWGRVSGNSR